MACKGGILEGEGREPKTDNQRQHDSNARDGHDNQLHMYQPNTTLFATHRTATEAARRGLGVAACSRS